MMLTLRAFCEVDFDELEDTSYARLSAEDRTDMLAHSSEGRHNGHAYELLTVLHEGEVVGTISLYAHTEHVVGIGPEIKSSRRKRGYAGAAMRLAFERARERGFTIVSNTVHTENAASIALHQKLGFEQDLEYTNDRGRRMYLFLKSIANSPL